MLNSLDELPVISVSTLALYLRDLLETNDILQNMWIHGEVSNCKTYPSGHCYFTLKEGDAQLPCVFFKSSRNRSAAPTLRDGLAVALNGRVAFYERDGRLQFYVESARLLGTGALFQRLEQLKARLQAEGLFDAERKKALPSQPATIGIVTSPQAAALRDMVRVLRTRYPLAHVILSPALVQGNEAPASIVAALDLLNEHENIDVIIVGRGGGSIEELWAFNDEEVVRAIARSRIPVISGVGHETDFTLTDFVADHRASTPTAAATAAVPDIADWQLELQTKELLLTELIQERCEEERARLQSALRELEHLSPQRLIEQQRQRLDESTAQLQLTLQHGLSLRTERLRGLALQLHSLSPLLTLGRGYAIVHRESGGETEATTITSIQQVQTGDQLTIQLQDGHIQAQVYS